MDRPTFIAWGDSAAGCIRERNRLRGEAGPVFAVPDDLRMGPLADADLPDAPQRTAWWAALDDALWWWPPETPATLRERHARYQHDLRTALASPAGAVVWIGDNAHDRLMLAMVCSLAPPQADLSVVDVSGLAEWRHGHQSAVAMCPPEALVPLAAAPLAGTARAALAHRWACWKRHGRGWRDLDADGQLQEYPPDHLDHLLLARIADKAQAPASRIVGEVMAGHPGLVPDRYLYWRLAVLRTAGRIVLAPSSGLHRQAPRVRLAGT